MENCLQNNWAEIKRLQDIQKAISSDRFWRYLRQVKEKKIGSCVLLVEDDVILNITYYTKPDGNSSPDFVAASGRRIWADFVVK